MGKVVVTGATGAIGRALVTEALENKDEVLVIVHKRSARAEAFHHIKGCSVLMADINE